MRDLCRVQDVSDVAIQCHCTNLRSNNYITLYYYDYLNTIGWLLDCSLVPGSQENVQRKEEQEVVCVNWSFTPEPA